MKYTICVTQQCNLRCKYCYIGKNDTLISLSTAEKIVEFIFRNTPSSEKIELGFFGGEPLLEFERIKEITFILENHPSFNNKQFEISVVTNGTIFNNEIADFLLQHNIGFCLSCDGPHYVQDTFRCFPNGNGSSEIVETNLIKAINVFPSVLVNAVYHPNTFQYLPQVIEYFSSLGLRQIYLNPDFSANWTKTEADQLPEIFKKVADLYIDYYLADDPHFISLIDSKISLILREGYRPLERCRMGRGEYAFAASGNIYPCERLIGSDNGDDHCIGNIREGIDLKGLICNKVPETEINEECQSCQLKDYCMNWCGCSNYFTSGYYNRVSPFLCTLEKCSIEVTFNAYQILDKNLGSSYINYLLGMTNTNCLEKY